MLLHSHPIELVAGLKSRLTAVRRRHRIQSLRDRGMHIGRDVVFPDDLFVDAKYCSFISVGDSTAFGPECMLLAHDAGPEQWLGAIRVGTVVVHPSCHI